MINLIYLQFSIFDDKNYIIASTEYGKHLNLMMHNIDIYQYIMVILTLYHVLFYFLKVQQ